MNKSHNLFLIFFAPPRVKTVNIYRTDTATVSIFNC
jgi:hypothetical protein